MASKRKPPWQRRNPKRARGKTTHLTDAEKTEARSAAKKAGRRYPNLVDNMRVARKKKRS